MLLEKSSFHVSKTSIQPNTSLDETKKSNNLDEVEDKKTFWSWFKGLINPLQNLPIISGIYSSLNSDNPESDRDLIQNSLGGFLYGGPFGAIAGFGTWAFNKIFNKTPTEFAFDLSGISNLWKKNKEKSIVTTEIDSKNLPSMQISKTDNNPSDVVRDREVKNLLKSGKELSLEIDKRKIENSNVTNQNKIVTGNLFTKSNLREEGVENTPSFRKIEFNYPEWKPQLKVSGEKKHLSQSEKDLYKNFIKEEVDIKNNLLINIDA